MVIKSLKFCLILENEKCWFFSIVIGNENNIMRTVLIDFICRACVL